MKRPDKHGRRSPQNLTAVTLERLAWGGRAVGHTDDGKVAFISKAVPGDRILARLDRQKSHYAEGRVHAVLAPSPDRVPPRCKFASHCGGCQWLSVAPARQRAEKEEMLRWSLREHIPDPGPEPLVFGEADLGYRHRGEFHAHAGGEALLLGFFQEASHKVVNLDTCPLFSRPFNQVYGELRRRLRAEPLSEGLEKMVLAASEGDSGFAAHLQMGRATSPARAEVLLRALSGAGLSGALVTPSKRHGEILAREGDPTISYGVEVDVGCRSQEITLRAGVRSFTQAHYALNRILVAEVLRWLALSASDRLLDLYAGAGNFSAPAASLCREVVSGEAAPWACADGRDNAQRLGFTNWNHLEGDSALLAAELAGRGERFDAVLLDPPRTGAEEVVPALGALNPSRVAYVSCNLPTLARDLGLLRAEGYRLTRVRGFDLFPQTYHIETLCLLEKDRDQA